MGTTVPPASSPENKTSSAAPKDKKALSVEPPEVLPRGERKRWHASWIIAAIGTLAIPGITAWTSLDMIPLIIIVSLVLILGVALLWILTPRKLHPIIKAVCTGVLTICAGSAIYWAIRYDRPFLRPEIGGLVDQPSADEVLVDVEALVKNTGRQGSYAENWRLKIDADSSTFEGDQRFGQKRPDGTVDEPQLFDQDFPVGKPVRGWLYFAFRGVSATEMRYLFRCGRVPATAKITLFLTDTKEKHIWSETRNLSDMVHEHCQPLPVTPPNPVSRQHGSSPHPPVASPQPPPATVSAPNGIAIGGNNSGNPTVNNNFESPAKLYNYNGSIIKLVSGGSITIEPGPPNPDFMKIESDIQSGNEDLALSEARDLATANPSWASPHILAGITLVNLGRLADAEAEYEAAKALVPDGYEFASDYTVHLDHLQGIITKHKAIKQQ